jgi:hypothetical protein
MSTVAGPASSTDDREAAAATTAASSTDDREAAAAATVDLHWIPLGAGATSVRLNGKVYEAVVALAGRRPRLDLYHSALVIVVPEGRFVVEMTPIPDRRGAERGVTVEGPVGSRHLSRLQLFRYEIRSWRDGCIPDLAYAPGDPLSVPVDVDQARTILRLVPAVPPLVWGRDERRTGEMWNSNSVTSWLLARAGLDLEDIGPPAGGRAPGWRAGQVVARQPSGVPHRP